jgi:hypothetical protein
VHRLLTDRISRASFYGRSTARRHARFIAFRVILIDSAVLAPTFKKMQPRFHGWEKFNSLKNWVVHQMQVLLEN